MVVFFLPSPAPAQEALQNSLAGEAAAESHKVHPESLPYTFKTGDLRVLVTPSLNGSWNDNINIAHTNTQQDFIITPAVQILTSYPVSQLNLLSLNVGIGWDQYIETSQYRMWGLVGINTSSTASIAPGVCSPGPGFHSISTSRIFGSTSMTMLPTLKIPRNSQP